MTSSTSSCPPILRGIQSALGPTLLSQILSSRVLLVGSGGIGCELLKNLALSGFRNVEIIDLDTIDVSNLNRQFLFRSQHVGMPKCVVASEAALEMIPPLLLVGDDTTTTEGSDGVLREAKYLPHHGNVCDNTKFNVPYIAQFALVLNALDNVAARRRVNRLCLAAGTPLIEAGTAGYLGQVTVIHKPSNTECYECQTKPTQKVYPICTIRSTPSQPVHCIVWAKELYKLCFGTKIEDGMLFEDEESLRADRESVEKETQEEEEEGGDGGGGGDGLEGKTDGEKSTIDGSSTTDGIGAGAGGGGGEKSTYMNAVKELRTLLGIDAGESKPSNNDKVGLRTTAQEALTALFVTEIEKQIGMDRYKTAEKVPVSISAEDIAKCTAADSDDANKPPTEREGYATTDIWNASDCIAEIAACFVEVASSTTQPLPEFDKDDEMAMRFVTAASNLRSYVFQIEPYQSLYSAKGIAGNIIPAIATTNAIVAGLQVLQAFHILKSQLDAKNGGEECCGLKEVCRYTYCLRDKTRKGYLLQPTTLPEPNPNCFVCRNATISLGLNTNEWTLDMLLHRVLKKELGFGEPTIMIGEDIVYEEGEDIGPEEYSANLKKKLVDLPAGGISHGTVIKVEDFTQDLEVEVSVSHKDHWTIREEDGSGKKKGPEKEDDREEIEKFEIGGKKPVASAAAAPEKNENGSAAAKEDMPQDADDSDDDIEVIEEEDDKPTSNGEAAKKRSLDSDDQAVGTSAKKAKLDDGTAKASNDDDDDDVEVIELE